MLMKSKKEYEKFFEMWKDADKDLPALIAKKKEYAKLKWVTFEILKLTDRPKIVYKGLVSMNEPWDSAKYLSGQTVNILYEAKT